MVNFSVFNELSLPLDENTAKEKFGIFFGLLEKLSDKGLNRIRISHDFKNYEILNNTTFQRFLGQYPDRDFKTRLKSFANNKIIKISSPIIQEGDTEQINSQQKNEYLYKKTKTDGGLACCDIWNTIAISFDSDLQWDKSNVDICKNSLDKNGDIVEKITSIKHASSENHLQSHADFFSALAQEAKHNITRENLWNKRKEFFPKIIIFCPEVEQQVKTIDKQVFDAAISILRDAEMGRKKITDYNCSPESNSVSQNPSLKRHRMFSVNGQKEFFTNHIKSLPSKYRIYFLEENSKIYIGYIGKHLPLT